MHKVISNSQHGLVQITPTQLSFLLLRVFSKTSETGQCGTLKSEKRNMSSASSCQTIAFSADLVQLHVFTGNLSARTEKMLTVFAENTP